MKSWASRGVAAWLVGLVFALNVGDWLIRLAGRDAWLPAALDVWVIAVLSIIGVHATRLVWKFWDYLD